MSRPDEDWSDLSHAWTDPTSEIPADLRADAALIRSVRRRDVLARLNFWSEILGGIVVTAVIVWVSMRTGLPWPVHVAAFAFVAFGMGLTLWSRRGDPGVFTETPDSVLRSAIAQARTGERWACAGVMTSVGAFVFLGTMRTQVASRQGAFDLIPTFAVLLAICVAAYVVHAVRCRRRRMAHEAALAALEGSH